MFRRLTRYSCCILGLFAACSMVSPKLQASCGDYLVHHGSSPRATSLDVKLVPLVQAELASIDRGLLVPNPSRPCKGPFCSGQPPVPGDAPVIPWNLDSRFFLNQIGQGLRLDRSRASGFYMTETLYLLETTEDIFHPPRFS
jgi:hypothetical protein